MDQRARRLLEKLFTASEKLGAGRRSRAAALTINLLKDYRSLRSFQAKEAFETTLRAARASGAISLVWDEQGEEGFIQRADVADARLLARFLGETPAKDRVAAAKELLLHLRDRYPVLNDVIQRWGELRKVRGLGPDSIQDWFDADMVIGHVHLLAADQKGYVPIREASARIFKDSKRIEKLTGALDVLLAGAVDAELRDPVEVWRELGLSREEQPVRMAGKVEIVRSRVTALLDAAYAAFPAPAVLGVASVPEMVLTIENLTTFHSEAIHRCEEKVLLIYTAGMPSPAWREMYRRLLRGLPESTQVFHWGDVDEGGFRIASVLSKDARSVGQTLHPWRMHPDNIPLDQRRPASVGSLERMRRFAEAAGWADIGSAIEKAGFTVEQEGI